MQHWRQKYRLPKRPSFATFLWWIKPFSCRERQTECKLSQGEDSSKSSTCFLSWWVTLMGSVAANFQRQFNITAGENLWTVNAILYNSWHETQHKALIKGIYYARHWSLLWDKLLILCIVLIASHYKILKSKSPSSCPPAILTHKSALLQPATAPQRRDTHFSFPTLHASQGLQLGPTLDHHQNTKNTHTDIFSLWKDQCSAGFLVTPDCVQNVAKYFITNFCFFPKCHW